MNDFHLSAILIEVTAFIWFLIASIIYLIAFIPPAAALIVAIVLYIIGFYMNNRKPNRSSLPTGPGW